MKNTGTTGTNGVDWEARVDFDRLRDERLARVKAELERSELGAVLAFDFSNIRYMTATHIGTWAMDKLIRFSLLTRNTDPISWTSDPRPSTTRCTTRGWTSPRPEMDADPHAPHEGTKRPRLESGARAGISTLRGAFPPDAGIAEEVARKIKRELEKFGVADQPLGVDVIELPILFALQQVGIRVVDGQQVFMEARRIKTNDEIRLLTQAASMVDAAYEDLYRFLRPGVARERGRGARRQDAVRPRVRVRRGRQRDLGRALLPAPARVLRPADPAGRPRVLRHPAQLERLPHVLLPHLRVGSASTKQKDAYTRAREYMDRAIALVRPGATTADIVSVWPTAQEFGFADEEAAFALQYGHGVGLSIWEKPIFSRLVSFDHPEELKEGMVFALETYWPSADGWGAARIEEEVVVTADGCEVITKFPAEELLIAGPRYIAVGGPLNNQRDSQSHLNTTWGRGEA